MESLWLTPFNSFFVSPPHAKILNEIFKSFVKSKNKIIISFFLSAAPTIHLKKLKINE